MMEWFENLEDMKGIVIKHLKEYPHTRDSDIELFYMILKDYYRAIPSDRSRVYMRSNFRLTCIYY